IRQAFLPELRLVLEPSHELEHVASTPERVIHGHREDAVIVAAPLDARGRQGEAQRVRGVGLPFHVHAAVADVTNEPLAIFSRSDLAALIGVAQHAGPLPIIDTIRLIDEPRRQECISGDHRPREAIRPTMAISQHHPGARALVAGFAERRRRLEERVLGLLLYGRSEDPDREPFDASPLCQAGFAPAPARALGIVEAADLRGYESPRRIRHLGIDEVVIFAVVEIAIAADEPARATPAILRAHREAIGVERTAEELRAGSEALAR